MLPQVTITETLKFNIFRVFKTKELAAIIELVSTLLGISKNVINLLLIASPHRNRDILLSSILIANELCSISQNVICPVFVPPSLQLQVVFFNLSVLIPLLLLKFLKLANLIISEIILHVYIRLVKKTYSFIEEIEIIFHDLLLEFGPRRVLD